MNERTEQGVGSLDVYGIPESERLGLIGALVSPLFPAKREVIVPPEMEWRDDPNIRWIRKQPFRQQEKDLGFNPETGKWVERGQYTPGEYGEPEYALENMPLIQALQNLQTAYVRHLIEPGQFERAVNIIKGAPSAIGNALIGQWAAIGTPPGTAARQPVTGEPAYSAVLPPVARAIGGLKSASKALAPKEATEMITPEGISFPVPPPPSPTIMQMTQGSDEPSSLPSEKLMATTPAKAPTKPLYHATFSKNIGNIKKEGLRLGGTTTLVPRGQERQLGTFAFTDPTEALRWASKLNREYEEPVSVFKLKGGERWVPDPHPDPSHGSQASFYTQAYVPPEDILGVLDVGSLDKEGLGNVLLNLSGSGLTGKEDPARATRALDLLQKLKNIGGETPPPPSEKLLTSTPKKDPAGFFNKSQRVVQEATLPSATGKKWQQFFLDKGVKRSELKGLGLSTFLGLSRDEPITKEAVADFIDENRLEVGEDYRATKESGTGEGVVLSQPTTLEGPEGMVFREYSVGIDPTLGQRFEPGQLEEPTRPTNFSVVQTRLYEVEPGDAAEWTIMEDRGPEEDRVAVMDVSGTLEEVKVKLTGLLRERGELAGTEAPRWSGNILDPLEIGAESLNYREIALMDRQTGGLHKNTQELINKLSEQASMAVKPITESHAATYQHDFPVNTLIHARVTDRPVTIDGVYHENVLHPEEFQSDWAQEAIDEGILRPEDMTRRIELQDKRDAIKARYEILWRKLGLVHIPPGFYAGGTMPIPENAVPVHSDNIDESLSRRSLEYVDMLLSEINSQPPAVLEPSLTPRDWVLYKNPAAIQKVHRELLETEKEMSAIDRKQAYSPFLESGDKKGSVDQSPVISLAISRVLREAVDNGQDYVVFANYNDQVTRWGETKLKSIYQETIPNLAKKIVRDLGGYVKPKFKTKEKENKYYEQHPDEVDKEEDAFFADTHLHPYDYGPGTRYDHVEELVAEYDEWFKGSRFVVHITDAMKKKIQEEGQPVLSRAAGGGVNSLAEIARNMTRYANGGGVNSLSGTARSMFV